MMFTEKSKFWIDRACKPKFLGNKLANNDILLIGIKTEVVNRWKNYVEKMEKFKKTNTIISNNRAYRNKLHRKYI